MGLGRGAACPTTRVGQRTQAKQRLGTATEVMESVVGTVLYQCPEIVQHEAYTEKADIWSLGCVLYQMAMLKPPFEGGNPLAVARKIVEASYPPLEGDFSLLLPEVRAPARHAARPAGCVRAWLAGCAHCHRALPRRTATAHCHHAPPRRTATAHRHHAPPPRTATAHRRHTPRPPPPRSPRDAPGRSPRSRSPLVNSVSTHPHSRAQVVTKLLCAEPAARPDILEVAALIAPVLMAELSRVSAAGHKLREEFEIEREWRQRHEREASRNKEAVHRLFARQQLGGATRAGAASVSARESSPLWRTRDAGRSPMLSISPSRIREIHDPCSRILNQLHKVLFISQVPSQPAPPGTPGTFTSPTGCTGYYTGYTGYTGCFLSRVLHTSHSPTPASNPLPRPAARCRWPKPLRPRASVQRATPRPTREASLSSPLRFHLFAALLRSCRLRWIPT